MEKIQPGKFVELGYDLYEITPDGTQNLVHQTDDADPEKLVFGVTPGVIVPLEKAIEGLVAGDKFDITVKAADAFGPVDPDQVAELEKEIFEVDGKFDSEMVKPGAVIIDVGTTRVADSSKKSGFRLSGDVDFDNVAPLCSYITPVPGGVGPMTICSLMRNTLLAASGRVY